MSKCFCMCFWEPEEAAVTPITWYVQYKADEYEMTLETAGKIALDILLFHYGKFRFLDFSPGQTTCPTFDCVIWLERALKQAPSLWSYVRSAPPSLSGAKRSLSEFLISQQPQNQEAALPIALL